MSGYLTISTKIFKCGRYRKYIFKAMVPASGREMLCQCSNHRLDIYVRVSVHFYFHHDNVTLSFICQLSPHCNRGQRQWWGIKQGSHFPVLQQDLIGDYLFETFLPLLIEKLPRTSDHLLVRSFHSRFYICGHCLLSIPNI